jgi:hypothetical protein
VALLPALAAVLFGSAESGRFRPERRSLLLAGALALLVPLNAWLALVDVGSVKLVRRELLAFSRWNALSRIEVQQSAGVPPFMTIDAMAATTIHSLVQPPWPEHQGISALVHVIRPRGKMLIIGPGGGVDVLAAWRAGHRDLVLVEINPIILEDVMLGRYRRYSGDLYALPGVRAYLGDGRSFVRRSAERFQVIQATLVDTWAASAGGAFALTENHLYTVEAFVDYLKHVTDDGVVTMSRWVGKHTTEFIRLCSLARAALERMGVAAPHRHLFAASTDRLGSLLISRRPLRDEELTALEAHCARQRLAILHSPRGRFHNPVALALGPNPRAFYSSFPADVRPTFDDRPFFFYGVKPERLMQDLLSGGKLSMNSYSAMILIALLAIVLLLLGLAIVLPLWLGKRGALAGNTGSKLRDLLFFVALGVGFILVELVLMQRLTLHLGHPMHALRLVLFGLLFAGGLGSLLSGRAQSERGMRLLLGGAGTAAALLLGGYVLLLDGLLAAAVHWPFAGRLALTLGLVAVPGLLMGTMLPTGVRLVSRRHAEIVPWAWGLNCVASVLGSVLAMVLALHLGFRAALLVGAAAYLSAVLLGRPWARGVGGAQP